MDQFPDGHQVLVGAPFNAAWHLQAFGQVPCFISRAGIDAMGESIRQAMAVGNLQTDPDYPTGTVKVTINKDEPSSEGFKSHRDLVKERVSNNWAGSGADKSAPERGNDLTTYGDYQIFVSKSS